MSDAEYVDGKAIMINCISRSGVPIGLNFTILTMTTIVLHISLDQLIPKLVHVSSSIHEKLESADLSVIVLRHNGHLKKFENLVFTSNML